MHISRCTRLRGILSLLSLLLTASSVWANSPLIKGLTHPDLEALPPPHSRTSITRFELDAEIKTKSPTGYAAVQSGFGLICGMWDFEAYRSFLNALKEDDTSILATSGLCLSLITSDRHLMPQLKVGFKHLKTLLMKEEGTEYERAFGAAFLKIATGNLAEGVQGLRLLAESDGDGGRLAGLLAAYMDRDGYSGSTPRARQKISTAILTDHLNAHPEDPATLSLFVSAQADCPDPLRFKEVILPQARALNTAYPMHPYYAYMRGYCELRHGSLEQAQAAFQQAYTLYDQYLKKDGIDLRNCRTLIDAKIAEISTLTLSGDYDNARREAKKLSKITLKRSKTPSLAQAALDWEANTAPLRIALFRESRSRIKQEADTLRAKARSVPKAKWELTEYYWEALSQYAYARIALIKKNRKTYETHFEQFIKAGDKLLNGNSKALARNQILYYTRANAHLEVMENELRARAELMRKPVKKVNFSTWVTNAIDAQSPSTGLIPPLWLTPMEQLKADYLYSIKEYEEAKRSYQDALKRQPHYEPAIKGLEKCEAAL